MTHDDPAAARIGLLSDQAAAVWIERVEALWNVHWTLAETGDHRAADVCIRLLDRMSRFYGLPW